MTETLKALTILKKLKIKSDLNAVYISVFITIAYYNLRLKGKVYRLLHPRQKGSPIIRGSL